MGDFHQTGVVSTLHRLGAPNTERLEAELEAFSQVRPIALILPVTYQDLIAPACEEIFHGLVDVPYVHDVIVTLGGTTRKEDFEEAKRRAAVLPGATVVWSSGTRMDALLNQLEESDLPVGADGKGRSVWLATGYVLAKGECQVIALHDCDIVNYSRELLARLCYPVTNPSLDYEFCKGYYSRVTDRMYGRVVRLFVTPLIRSFIKMFGYLPFLTYMDSFRYPLAGEFSIVTPLVRINRVPGDWGLEVGTLAEVYRNCALRRICQAELVDNYDHKHQDLSADDPDQGLLKMSIDIAKVFFRTLASEGVVFSDGMFKSLRAAYVRIAQDTSKQYASDAAINSLFFDRHEEALAIEAFTQGLSLAGATFMEDPLGTPQIPNWSRVTSAIPDFLDTLRQAVDQDN